MDVMPANIGMSGFEELLVNAMSRETVLRAYLSGMKRSYDYILNRLQPLPRQRDTPEI